jgi:hypothetical protein
MEKKRNLWVVPTDKPSRLHFDGKLFISTNTQISREINSIVEGRNIYITNDEEIKEGNWLLNPNGIFKVKPNYINCNPTYKKIILTTDTDLIKDGVQSIDDEFLEWFVKNPSCEFAEYNSNYNRGNGKTYYKIIIPKEEPNYNMKEEILAEMERFEEPKQETLEEVSPMNDLLIDLKETKISVKESIDIIEDEFMRTQINIFVQKTLDSVIDRIENELLETESKWQQEQDKNKYSEEELKSAFNIGFNIGYGSTVQELDLKNEHCDKWFEQFKKK